MDNKKVADLVDMLDRLVSQGSGHINVTAEDADGDMNVTTGRSLDCGNNPTACSVPTLHKGIDDIQEE